MCLFFDVLSACLHHAHISPPARLKLVEMMVLRICSSLLRHH